MFRLYRYDQGRAHTLGGRAMIRARSRLAILLGTVLLVVPISKLPGQDHQHAPIKPGGKQHEKQPARSGSTPLGLPDLEQLALQNNPTLKQAALQVEAARGKALQAGLSPNR